LGGPLVLHEPTWSQGDKPFAVIVAPLISFKQGVLALAPDHVSPGKTRLSYGPQGQLLNLPPNFAVDVAITTGGGSANSVFQEGSAKGITAAVYSYGST